MFDYGLLYFYVFFVGTCIGSFTGLVVDRLPHQLHWREDPKKNWTIYSPRSQCNNCNVTLSWAVIIPILGYFWSKGKCRSCGKKIPIYYLICELIFGVMAVFIYHKYGFGTKGVLTATLLFSLLFLAWIDIKEHWLPAVVTIPLFWLGLLFTPWCSDPLNRIEGAALGFFLPLIAMYIVSKIKKQDLLAGGDIALISVAGAWLGIDNIVLYIISSNLIFILYSIPARIKGVHFVPMGPALVVGFFVCIL